MKKPQGCAFRTALLTVLCLTAHRLAYLAAGDSPAKAAPTVMRLTVEEAKKRALANSKLLGIGEFNAEGKGYAVKAARADYFPKVIGSAMYFHFQDDLGKVLTTPGRHLTGPRGRSLLSFPPQTIEAAVLNQNSSFATVSAS